jgi:DNA-binding NarL/FixJ family response regulator
MYDEPGMMEQMHQPGADSYVLKTAPSKELLAAIRGEEPSS